jgi:DNA topoisomerase I
MAESNLTGKKLLVIVESPTKSQHIQEYLRKAGYNAKVMASKGHIMELANGGSYFNTGVDPKNGFKMDIKVSQDKKDTVAKLKAQADWADLIVLMSDPDREGYVISWSLIKFLKLPKSRYVRAVTHEITPKAVIDAIEHPVKMDDDLVEAGLARMALDKMLGFRLSPVARNAVGARSVGRCQSCGLKLIADREREIQNFKPETYYDLYLNFEKNGTAFKAKYVGTAGNPIEHLKSDDEVKAVKAACIGDYMIQGIDKKEKQESPKPPFNTPSFQQEASSKLGLSVKDAMSVAQKIFEAGKITYMRTDDDTMSPEFLPVIENYVKATYGDKAYNKPRAGKKTGDEQAGHECLRVTNPALTPSEFAKIDADDLHQKVYRMIWQRTIAACLPNAVYSETGYLIDNSGQKFLLASKELIEEGFRVVYNYKDDDDPDGEVVKETFKKGEKLQKCLLEDQKKATKPKPRYTEATLVKELQKQGVGRPSTYATIVDTVLSESRGYATKDGKSIVPTELGMKLAEYLDKYFNGIIKLDYTREMEESLDKIASGKLTRPDFLQRFYDAMESTIKSDPSIKASQATDKTCPECGKPLVIRRSKYGKSFLGCSGYPKCHHIENLK